MSSGPRHTAVEVARYVLRFAHSKGSLVTNLKLQKLLYYAQGWHLAIFNKPLFGDSIEAWVHGPVVPKVYQKYKKYRWQPIGSQPNNVSLSPQTKRFMQELLEVFLPIDAFQLERMTHREPPWIEARGSLEPDAICHNEISQERMQSYFTELADEN